MKEQERIDQEREDKINRSIKMEKAKIQSKQQGFLNVSRRSDRSGSKDKEKSTNVSKNNLNVNTSKLTDYNRKNESVISNEKSNDRPPIPKKIN